MSKNSPLKCLSCSEVKINFRPTLLYTFMEKHVGLSYALVLPYASIPENVRPGHKGITFMGQVRNSSIILFNLTENKYL